MSEIIYVLDIETDHLNFKFGSILEIGIVSLNFLSGEIISVFSSLVQEKKKINPGAWIFKNSSLNFLDLITAPVLDDLKFEFQKLFLQGEFTAFNQKFDFGWLESRGFKFPYKFLDPMLILTPIMKLNHKYYSNKYPSVEEAFLFLFKEQIKETHRALEDATIEAKIILEMAKKGYF